MERRGRNTYHNKTEGSFVETRNVDGRQYKVIVIPQEDPTQVIRRDKVRTPKIGSKPMRTLVRGEGFSLDPYEDVEPVKSKSGIIVKSI